MHGRKPKGHGCPISEQCVVSPGNLRVDRDNSVIFGVKILGKNSDNGRIYTDACLQMALPLYEGIAVNVDHPKKPTDMRSAYDRIGRIKNVQLKPDGIYGDLYLLKSHELTERVMEAAEKMPELFGLSHNADGRVVSGGNHLVVEEITEVRHVDLVADPATNKSMFESKEVKKTFKQYVSEAKLPKKLKSALLEMMDEEVSSMEMESPMGGGKSWKQCLVDAISSLIETGDEESHKKAQKIMAFLKPDKSASMPVEGESDLGEGEGEDEEMEDMDSEPSEDEEQDDEYMEEAKKRIAKLQKDVKELTEAKERLELREHIREVCKRNRVEARESLLESCVLMKDRNAIENHIEDISEMAKASTKKRPRSIGYGSFPVVDQGSDYDAFIKTAKQLKGN